MTPRARAAAEHSTYHAYYADAGANLQNPLAPHELRVLHQVVSQKVGCALPDIPADGICGARPRLEQPAHGTEGGSKFWSC